MMERTNQVRTKPRPTIQPFHKQTIQDQEHTITEKNKEHPPSQDHATQKIQVYRDTERRRRKTVKSKLQQQRILTQIRKNG